MQHANSLEIEFLNGPRVGKRLPLYNTVTRFGRAGNVDVLVDWDGMVSSQHCCIRIEDECYVLEDLGSRNGTYVNEERVTKAHLADGDQIKLGQTMLRVVLPSRLASPANSAVRAAASAGAANILDSAVATAHRPAAGHRTLVPIYAEMEQLDGDVVRLKGDWPPDWEDARWIFSFQRPDEKLYAIFDPKKAIGFVSVPASDNAIAIFDWLKEAARSNSPLLLVLDKLPEWPHLVEEQWDFDSLIILQSSKGPEELLQNLRGLIRDSSADRIAGRGILGICWPSVMEAVLKTQCKDFAPKLFDFVSLIIFARSDHPKGWQAFAPSEIIKPLGNSLLRFSTANK